MKAILNAADKLTKNALYVCLILFAVACVFSGCQVSSGNGNAKAAPRTAVQENEPEAAILTDEENSPETFEMGEFRLTAYCACEKCCGKWADGITATGTTPTAGRTIAVDQDVIPYGSEVIINGHTYRAEDCGGAIIGNRIDVYFDNHEEATEFGVQYADVTLLLNGGETV